MSFSVVSVNYETIHVGWWLNSKKKKNDGWISINLVSNWFWGPHHTGECAEGLDYHRLPLYKISIPDLVAMLC